MNAEQVDQVYTALSEALGRTHGDETRLLLAILALDLVTRIDPDDALAALARAERLARV